MSDSRCKAITTSGEQCRLKAGSSGYCHIHDPDRIAERAAARKAGEEARRQSWVKGERLREVIKVVRLICKAKGWETRMISQDWENWRYATISVERYVKSGHGYETITGIVEISVDGMVKVSLQPTSFHSYGLQDLHDAILAEVGRLPGLGPSKKTPTG